MKHSVPIGRPGAAVLLIGMIAIFAPVQLLAQPNGLIGSVLRHEPVDESFSAILKFPTDAQTSSLGLTLDVEVIDWQLPGYGDVKITLRSPAVSAAEQNLVVRFDSVGEETLPPRRGVRVDVPITLPQGERSVVVRASVACFALARRIGVSVRQEGRVVEGFAGQLRTQYNDVDAVLDAYLKTQQTLTVESAGNLGVAANSPADVLRIDTTLFDASSRDALQTVRDHLLGGGLVVATEHRDASQWSADLNLAMTKLKRDLFVERIAAKRLLAVPTFDRRMLTAQEIELIESFSKQGIDAAIDFNPNVTATETPQTSASKTSASKTSAKDFAVESYTVGAGQFVQPAAGSSQSEVARIKTDLPRLVRRGFPTASSSLFRRGVDPMLGDNRFSQWMVPGVSQPPVYTFIGLLSAFVVLVGPIAYRKTTRNGRGYLMFAIAPLLAIITTLSMFAYGIIADGFGTIVRIRQLTFVDGASGDASERSRVTYFAGIRPGGGIDFGRDWKVYPYPDSDPRESWEAFVDDRPASAGSITIDQTRQNFSSAFLPSRQQRQFVIESKRTSLGRLTFDAPDPASPPQLSNEFPFEVRSVLVRDEQGVYWTLDQIGPGQSKPMTNLPKQMPSILLGEMYNAYWPIAETGQTRSGFGDRGTRDLVAVVNGLTASPNVSLTGNFETLLNDLFKNDASLPRKYFAALADPSPDMNGVKDAEVKESVRYLVGTMP